MPTPKPAVFHKLRKRVVEEIALAMVVDMISPDGDIMIPASWLSEADLLCKDLLMMLSDETQDPKAVKKHPLS